jgi:hypothetical protein
MLLLLLTLHEVWVVVADDIVCHKLHQTNLQQQQEQQMPKVSSRLSNTGDKGSWFF